MKSFTYECVTLQDFCEHNNLNYPAVIDAVSASDISFGTNYDTLIHAKQLEAILEDYDMPTDKLDYNGYDTDKILISLGS